MKELSDMEQQVAEQYCHGFTDKEIAAVMDKPIWTVRTHKKHIYKKLSIATTHELVLYMVAKFVGRKWDAKEVKRKGLAALLLSLMLFNVITVERKEYRRGRRVRIECTERRKANGEEL
ncbi:MAG: response regulator transcription factor [Bacteroidaceae bacterium]|nr:response regulator transcription factor [Bacteroidaceae bacterium]